jgi:uncharacterized membrane protein
MLSIIGIVAIVVLTIQVYKTAKNTERNAAFWAIINACVGFGIQFVLPFAIGLVLAIIWLAQGTTDPVEIQSRIYGPALVIGVVCLVLSIVGMWIIFKIVSKVPDQPPISTPPPPTEFQQ